MPLLVTCNHCGEQVVWSVTRVDLLDLEVFRRRDEVCCLTCRSESVNLEPMPEEVETRGEY